MLRDEIKSSLKVAMREKNTAEVATIRLILAALKDRDIAARGNATADTAEEGIGESDILAMLQTMVKQRRESASLYREGGREELAAAEEAEIVIIERFLPAQLDEAEMAAAIDTAIAEIGATSVKDMGRTMASLRERHVGRMDFAAAGAMVKQRLMG